MQTFINPSPEIWPALCTRPQAELEFLENSVKNILARVQRSGDEAVRELTKQYDKADVTQLQLTQSENNCSCRNNARCNMLAERRTDSKGRNLYSRWLCPSFLYRVDARHSRKAGWL